MLSDFLASRILVPLLSFWRGGSYGSYINDVAKVQTGSLENIRKYQLSRLRLVCECANTIPLYRERFLQAGVTDFSRMGFDEFNKVEPIGREDIRALGNYLMEQGGIGQDVVRSATGGTTSSPVSFYMTKDCADHRWSATRFFDAQLGYVPGKKIAYLWGAPQDIPNYGSPLKSYLMENWFERKKFVAASSLSESQMLSAYQQLKKFRPSFLQAYPTSLYILSKFMLRNNLRLKVPAITCTAEAVTEEHKNVIEQAFGVRPFAWYGARDAGRIATECQLQDGMHINSYGLLVESTADAGPGRLLVTDLWNDLMPIIRYDIGDVAEIDNAACSCGCESPRLKNLSGRVVDLLVATDGRIVPGVTLTNRIVKESSEIKELQVIQLNIGLFKLKVVPGDGYQGDDSVSKLRKKLEELMNDSCDVEVEIVNEIPLERSGKKRFCVNLMSDDEMRKYI